MTALPKEVVRHFTLLKEVDAKIFGPEDQLFKLIAAANTDATTSPQPDSDSLNRNAQDQGATVPQVNSTGATPVNAHQPGLPSASETQGAPPTTFDLSSLPRQHLLRQTSYKIHELLVSLEEKNHVLSTANEALQKHITRIEDVWPYLEDEYTDEAKWGSTSHWAYPENRVGKASQAERTRRDGAAAISAAAQALADEAAARSDARKQAVQAKKSLKNNHLESDFDDPDGRSHKTEGGKKSKSRKTVESGVGLGITTGAANGNPPPKKRKVEKGPNGGAAADRAMASVFGGAAQPKAKTNSPRGTPAPDGPKKRKALPSGSGQAKKRYISLLFSVCRRMLTCTSKPSGTMSPSIVQSPVVPPLPEPKAAPRGSPAPSTAPRPPSSRSRQNSLHSAADNGKSRPPSSAANKPNGRATATPDIPLPKEASLPAVDPKAVAKPSAPIKPEPAKKEPERAEPETPVVPPMQRKETKPDETDLKSEPTPPTVPPPTVTTKSGRASKPSTPALANFPDAARSRPSRGGDGSSSNSNNGNGNGKKGHKKSGSTVQQAPPPPPPRMFDEDATSSAQGDDDEADIDADEPRYCYCNGVSYGEMVACDSDDCAREWFHLACVGLKVAPGSKSESTSFCLLVIALLCKGANMKFTAKWYCEDCKERLKGGRQKPVGR